MKSMKKVLLALLAGVMAMALVVPTVAQDATATPDASGSTSTTNTTSGAMGSLTCDSSLILLAGLAERYFGYTTPSDITMSNYAYGQFSPLFDTQGTTSTGTSAETTPEATTDVSVEATADTSSTTTNPTLAPGSVMLNSPVIAGEDPACTQLRTNLENFFSTQLQSGDWDANFRKGLGSSSSSGG